MRIGRVDVVFSHKDKALWDVIETAEKGDRGYWLKYYAAIGIAAAKNNKIQPILFNPLETTNHNITASTKSKQPSKRVRKETKETVINDSKTQENFSDSDSIPFSEPSASSPPHDPLERRRAAMGNMLKPDDELLNFLSVSIEEKET